MTRRDVPALAAGLGCTAAGLLLVATAGHVGSLAPLTLAILALLGIAVQLTVIPTLLPPRPASSPRRRAVPAARPGRGSARDTGPVGGPGGVAYRPGHAPVPGGVA